MATRVALADLGHGLAVFLVASPIWANFRGSSGVFFVAAELSQMLSRKRSAVELNSMSQAEVERATSTRVQAGFGVSDPATRDTLDGDEPSVRIRIPTGPVTPSAEEKTLHKISGHAPYRRWCRWCAAVRTADEPHLREQQPETDEAMSRIEFDSGEFEGEEDQTLSTSSLNAFTWDLDLLRWTTLTPDDWRLSRTVCQSPWTPRWSSERTCQP